MRSERERHTHAEGQTSDNSQTQGYTLTQNRKPCRVRRRYQGCHRLLSCVSPSLPPTQTGLDSCSFNSYSKYVIEIEAQSQRSEGVEEEGLFFFFCFASFATHQPCLPASHSPTGLNKDLCCRAMRLFSQAEPRTPFLAL